MTTFPEWHIAFPDRDYKSVLFPVLNPALFRTLGIIDTPHTIYSTKAV
jgi:hypothetical protein